MRNFPATAVAPADLETTALYLHAVETKHQRSRSRKELFYSKQLANALGLTIKNNVRYNFYWTHDTETSTRYLTWTSSVYKPQLQRWEANSTKGSIKSMDLGFDAIEAALYLRKYSADLVD